MAWLPSWPVFGVMGAAFGVAMWKLIRSRAPLACPACDGEPAWTGSGTKSEPAIEYRIYKCACGERLVQESHGRLQRLDDWVPGRPPQVPTKARVRRDNDG